jgi:predicted amidohydrolase YtcJ
VEHVSPIDREGRAHSRIDLQGKTVLPGLIDAHVHALGAGLSEYKQALKPLRSIADVQAYILARAKVTPKGEWIVVPRTLPPRLKEMRMPTRADLDVVTDHPVAFDGSYVWSANSKALAISGISAIHRTLPGARWSKMRTESRTASCAMGLSYLKALSAPSATVKQRRRKRSNACCNSTPKQG